MLELRRAPCCLSCRCSQHSNRRGLLLSARRSSQPACEAGIGFPFSRGGNQSSERPPLHADSVHPDPAGAGLPSSAFPAALLGSLRKARGHGGPGFSLGRGPALSPLSGGPDSGRPPAHTRTSLPEPGFRREPWRGGGGGAGREGRHVTIYPRQIKKLI